MSERTHQDARPGRLLIIVPAHDEEGQIGPLVEGIRAAVPRAEVLVVDDASTDATARRAREAGARVVTHTINLGYGATIQTGYKYALAHGYDVLAQLDGDGQHDPESLPELLAPVERGDCDVAIGSRFLGKGRYQAPLLRRLGMRWFGMIAGWVLGRRVTDPTSGYQAMNRRALRLYCLDLFPHDYPDADTLILLHFAGLRSAEVPVLMHASPTGRSIHSGLIRPMYYIFKMTLAIFVHLISRRAIRRWNDAA